MLYIQNKTYIDVNIIKTMILIIGTYVINLKIVNKKEKTNLIMVSKYFILAILSIFCIIIRNNVNYFIYIVSLIFSVSIIFSSKHIGNSILITIISLAINFSILIVSITISFILNLFLKTNNDYLNIFIIMLVQIIFIYKLFNIKKMKYGITFLQENIKNEYIDILVLSICTILIFTITILPNLTIILARPIACGIIIYIIIMFITIQKSLQLYYKQKLLVQELEETKKELANKKEELQNVEKENINISKKNHTLAHKQKSLEHKIEEMINKSEVSKEEAEELKRRLKEIGKDLYKEKETIELDKTGIPEIDDMMKYMQSECKKNKIEFEYQLKGNIYYMTNNLISKEDLETLLADHIKNAIIAINHTNNLNRSILVRLGKIDENYGLYIYDSGIEFKPEIFEKLGKEPSTTHPDEGGTGMGFMNTFDTLRKYNASLTIEEYDKPNKDNYTKVLIIKFDGKKEFKIKSYQLKETIKIG